MYLIDKNVLDCKSLKYKYSNSKSCIVHVFLLLLPLEITIMVLSMCSIKLWIHQCGKVTGFK